MTNPIIKAIEPLRADAQDAAEAAFRAQVAQTYTKLEEAGWDIEKVAPRAHSRMSRRDYKAAQARRWFVGSITETSEVRVRLPGEGLIVQADLWSVEKQAARVREDAGAAFDAFGLKLVGKVGEGVTEASIKADCGVWVESTLTVTKADGSAERWLTKRIINCSVHGKLFHQWPTRKLRAA